MKELIEKIQHMYIYMEQYDVDDSYISSFHYLIEQLEIDYNLTLDDIIGLDPSYFDTEEEGGVQ